MTPAPRSLGRVTVQRDGRDYLYMLPDGTVGRGGRKRVEREARVYAKRHTAKDETTTLEIIWPD